MRSEHWLFGIPLRLRSLFRRAQADQELDDELRHHLERKSEEYVAKGIAPEEARRRARLDLGGVEKVKEEGRDARRVNWIQDFVQDLHFGLRTLRKSPGFAAAAVMTLALGIAANTAIFSMVNGVMLRALPYDQSQKLYVINEQVPQFTGNSPFGAYFPVNAGNFLLWQGQCPALSSMALIGAGVFNMTGQGTPSQVNAIGVSADFLPMMGILPQLGRTFLPEEDAVGHDHEVILSARFWDQAFNSDSRIIGKSIVLDNVPYTVGGVALGADRGEVLGMVMWQGVKLAIVGVGIGIAAALGLTRSLLSLLYGVRPSDPPTFIATTIIPVSVALLASYVPARRAMRVDPMVALRYE